jgi:hypothetical protein
MTVRDLTSVVNRAFALLLSAWAFVEATFVPERVFSLLHHLRESSVLNTQDYLTKYYSMVLIFFVVRIVVLLVVAIWFWKHGLPSDVLMPELSQKLDTSN